MDARAADLLRHFVGKLGGEAHVGVRRGSGKSEHWETFTEIDEVVTGFFPEQGVVELQCRNGQSLRLQFDEAELLHLLNGLDGDDYAVWGERLSDEETAARFLTIFLQESLCTREAHPSGWWAYEACSFTPLPPWEAFAQRRQRR